MWMVFAESILSYGSFVFAIERTTQQWKDRYGMIYNGSLKKAIGVAKTTEEKKLCFALRVLRWNQLVDLKYVNVATRLLRGRSHDLPTQLISIIKERVKEILDAYDLGSGWNFKMMREHILDRNALELLG